MKNFILAVIAAVFVSVVIPIIYIEMFWHTDPVIISPVPEGKVYITPSPTPKWIETEDGQGRYREDICDKFKFFEMELDGKKQQICPKPQAPQKVIQGKASYYSRAGCLGCSETLTMANGEPLDDSRLTVAFNHAKLGAIVQVSNQKTGKVVSAEVTDRGGFERHGKIIDLTIATRDAIGCGPVCDVEVSL